MVSINIPSAGHTGPAANSGWQWLPYTDADFLATLHRAMHVIDSKIKGYQPCNAAFQTLPRGRSFAQVWNDPTVWISFDPKNDGHNYGATLGQEVTITRFSLRMGLWTTAATLVHELAHVNGADGFSHAAEGTLRSCLLQGLEDPTIVGSIDNVARGQAFV